MGFCGFDWFIGLGYNEPQRQRDTERERRDGMRDDG
jgi:hypothetical protein